MCEGPFAHEISRAFTREVLVQGQQIRDQFYYAVALNQQRTWIVQLQQRVNQCDFSQWLGQAPVRFGACVCCVALSEGM
jgi:hypothetical protein